ncbi:MAG TPA: glycosyltransferase, partial [Anaerolineae bacterium]|nr:glycosyltransferase [Anaerolineae bacterium]
IPLSDSGYYLTFGFNRTIRKLLATMDVLHAQHPFLTGAIGATLARRHGIPFVFTSHTRYDLYAQHYLPAVPTPVSDAFLETFFPAFSQMCDLIIAPAQSILNVLRDWGVVGRIEIVPNGIDVQAFRNPQVQIKRTDVGLPPDAVTAIFVGRMAEEKSVTMLLRTFAPVAKEIPRSHLLMVGGGPALATYQAEVREMGIADRVHFTDRVPYEAVPGYLALADLFVTASVSEVHPLTLLEALAAGLPVLGIRSPGIADTVEPGVNGFLVENDRAALALKLARLLEDESLRHQLAEGARKASEHYDIRITSARILELYQEVVAAKPKNRKRWFWFGR